MKCLILVIHKIIVHPVGILVFDIDTGQQPASAYTIDW